MNLCELNKCVRIAIDILHIRDEKLFANDASEMAIAHRLAIYLEQLIPGWDVDCEYNSQGEGDNLDPKRSATSETRNSRPDITLHHRGIIESDHNLLVIELKKKNGDTSDVEKTRGYTNTPQTNDRRIYKYQFGLVLSFLPELKLVWYADGAEIIPTVSN